MKIASAQSLRERNRQTAREVMLDAAERLLRSGDTADFSMRALAAEAGVGFATPFNHFGSKTEIMRALSTRLIERMADAFRRKAVTGDFVDRAFAMSDIAVTLLIKKPDVFRAVISSLGVAATTPSAVMPQSTELWSMALGDLTELPSDVRTVAQSQLPRQLAFAFRGCLSFWAAGEVTSDALIATVRIATAMTLLGFCKGANRQRVLAELTRRDARRVADDNGPPARPQNRGH